MRKVIFVFTFILSFMVFFGCSDEDKDNPENDSDNIGDGPKCGNGVIDEGEECDGNVPCWQVGCFYPETNAICASDCSGYDTKQCVAKNETECHCGDGQVQTPPETCELGSTITCKELLKIDVEGNAKCNRYCTGWDTTDCPALGTKTCSQIFDCVTECADDSCKEKCVEDGSEDGKGLYEKLKTCSSANCTEGDKECLQEKCVVDYDNCFPLERCGNGKIDEGELCEKGETKPCQEVGKNWQPMNEAVCDTTCSDWVTSACVDKSALTCFQVYDCVGKCSDSTCENECLGKTWPAARAKYDAMVECIDKNCAVVTDECLNENCKFQTDACKTHLSCGNKNIDMYEICEKAESIDCGEIKDESNESIYEAETANAFCNVNCTEWITSMCYKFCSCSEIKACVAKECGEYTTATKECMETCEENGSMEGNGEHSGWRKFIESCSDNDGNKGFASKTCVDQANKDYTCGSSDNPKCPY